MAPDASGSVGIQSVRLFENCLWFEECLNPVLTVFAANAGVLETTPWGLRVIGHVIDHDPSRSNLRGHAARTLQISSEDSSMKAVLGIVSNPDRVIIGIVSDHAENRTEDFLPGNRHVVRHVDEYRRLNIKALFETFWTAYAADQHLCAFFDTFANVAFHPVILLIRNHRSNGDAGVCRITNRNGAHRIGDSRLYLFEPGLWNEKTCTGGARLATVQKGHDEC